ncbi:hypothetical protein [Flavobacterium foetidum]|uniref:hypothetical protein n=1 Tax=Flavobacterium foetidum TaxID=2026681 RepID=UPI001075095F|nr:hypothetical protein [Flavobacterium foetidum]KAF2509106.1 hypothetical protein E0W73_19040 [Flavobacterium foetidum]
MTNNNFSHNLIGSIKPLLLLITAIVFFVITIKSDYTASQKTFHSYSINKLPDANEEEFEISHFYIGEQQREYEDAINVMLYSSEHDTLPKAILVVKDLENFKETYKEKAKVAAKQYDDVVTINMDIQGKTTRFANTKDKFFNGKYIQILKYEPYFSWKSVWWTYPLFLIMIIFLSFILLARIKVY